MALMVQATGGGGVRVVPARALSRAVRARAAGIGRTGIHHRGRAGETRPGAGLSLGGILRGIGRAAGGFVTGGVPGAIGGLTRSAGKPRPAPTSPILSFAPLPTQDCAPGFRVDPTTGRCVRSGFIGGIERFVPGGATGTQADVQGDAVMGGFGLPAVIPAQVGSITRRDGTTGPILRCPRRMVLGADNLCYPKAILGRRSKFRKHRLPTKPPVTAADRKAIRTAARVRDDVLELAKDVGLHASKTRPSKRKK